MEYERFVKVFSRKYKAAFSEVYGFLFPLREEHTLRLKSADEILCEIRDSFFDPFVLRKMIEPYWETLKKIGRKNKICTWYSPIPRIISWSPEKIIVEGASYFDVFAFHYIPEVLIGRKTLREILWPMVFSDGRYIPLEKSQFPNPLGVHVLIFSSDGFLIITKRSKNVILGKNMLSPTVEGVPNIPLGENKCSLAELINDEIEDELGLGIEDYSPFAISFARSAYLMGRPSVYFVAIAKLSAKEILNRSKRAKDVWERNALLIEKIVNTQLESPNDFFMNAVRNSLKKLFMKYRARKDISTTLLFVIAKLLEFISEEF